jgi:hypothetical protein
MNIRLARHFGQMRVCDLVQVNTEGDIVGGNHVGR